MEVWIWNIPRSDPLQGTFFVLEVEPWNIPDSHLHWPCLKGSQWKSGSGIFHGLPPLATEQQFVCVNVRHGSAAKQTSYRG